MTVRKGLIFVEIYSNALTGGRWLARLNWATATDEVTAVVGPFDTPLGLLAAIAREVTR